MEVNMLDVKLKDVELKNNLIEKIVREEIKLQNEKEEIKILGELVKHQQNNWNELKKWLEELDKTFCETTTRDNSEFYHFQRGELMFLRNIKLKMQELENRKV